ncbi:MAG: hypothetical protein V2I33_16305 [Kangiellaceae bacterium]|nr:hypothetical protein [Kangiellaceae bacterium]
MSENKQLRGEALLQRIESIIRKQCLEARKSGKNYIYNATSVSKEVPTTRVTLNKHGEFIQKVLNSLKAERRSSSGQAIVDALRDKIEDLKDEITKKDEMISALRRHHIAIFETLHANSIIGKELIRPILEVESDEADECILCGPSTKQDPTVIDIKRRK